MRLELIVSAKVPLRISFVGGGSDLYEFYHQLDGAVVSCAIDKHVTVSVRKSPGATRITSDIVNYEGPTQDCPDRLLREALLYCGIQRGLTVHIESDVSPGSGLGSSSAVVIGIVTAVGALRLDR